MQVPEKLQPHIDAVSQNLTSSKHESFGMRLLLGPWDSVKDFIYDLGGLTTLVLRPLTANIFMFFMTIMVYMCVVSCVVGGGQPWSGYFKLSPKLDSIWLKDADGVASVPNAMFSNLRTYQWNKEDTVKIGWWGYDYQATGVAGIPRFADWAPQANLSSSTPAADNIVRTILRWRSVPW